MNSGDALRITPKLIVGLGILFIGFLWTLDNLDFIEADNALEWWPLILVLVGLSWVLNPRSSRMGGVIMMIFGTILLLDSIDLLDFDFGDLIPLAVMAVGAKIAWDAFGRRGRVLAGSDPSSKLSAFAIMAGVNHKSTSQEFRGGDANAIMGGVEIDLRNAKIAQGEEAVIDAFALWGGVDITVPEDWQVRGSVMPLLGGFEDKTHPTTTDGPVLLIRGTALMGAIEVKN